MVNKNFTVFVDGELWTDVVDDMNSNKSWGNGGIIFLCIEAVNDFVNNLRTYDEWRYSTIEVKEIRYANTE